MQSRFWIILSGFIALLSGSAYAAEVAINAADTAWVAVCCALVLLMTPGLAFFYGGLVRSKTVLNTMMMSFIAMGIVAVLWVLVGYSLAFDTGNAFIGTLKYIGLEGLDGQAVGTIPAYVFVMFQIGFAVITPALISGAIVERMKFGAYVLFITLWSLLIYIPIVHWVWTPNGWLYKMGVLDLAGGFPIEVASGVSSLVAALMVGSRLGFPRRPMVPHNMPLVLLGVGLLWVGWLGFNAGSALSAGHTAARALITTNTAAAAAMLMWLLLESLQTRRATALGAATGTVAGLVAITPAASFISPLAALGLGALAATVSYFVLQRKHSLGFDDTLDVFAVHGMGGIVGVLFTGAFAFTTNQGAAPLQQLGIQSIALVAVVALCVVGTWGILKILDLTIGLRANTTEEIHGLDSSVHQESAYNQEDFGWSAEGVSISAPVVMSSD